MWQKIISVGNSAAITIPKGFLKDVGVKIGDKVRVNTDSDTKTMKVEAKSSIKSSLLDKSFTKWTDSFIKKHQTLLEELAQK